MRDPTSAGGTDVLRDRESLIRALRAGLVPRFVFFWGHTAADPLRPGHAAFSQWWPAPFEVAGTTYPTAEHFMMAEKARIFEDDETRSEILRAPSPAAAKALGRKVRGFDEARWAAARFDVVVHGNLEKFGAHDDLRRILLSTGDAILVEASPTDRIWGIGLAESDPRAQAPQAWRGENLLGFALGVVRATFAPRG
jgi:ribA/ribD-fused uncharacterized protein